MLRSVSLMFLCLSAALWSVVRADQTLAPGQSFRDCPQVCPEVVVIRPATYLMGSSANDPRQAKDGIEQPQHRVTLRHAFAVGKFEVTREEYARFALATHLVFGNFSTSARSTPLPYLQARFSSLPQNASAAVPARATYSHSASDRSR